MFEKIFGKEIKESRVNGVIDDNFFDPIWYAQRYPAAMKQPKMHYARFGYDELYDPNPLFSCRFYLANNPDVAAASIHPIEHYLQYGAAEGRQPHPAVAPEWLARKLDLDAGTNVIGEYLSSKRDFPPRPFFDLHHIADGLGLPRGTDARALIRDFLMAPPGSVNPNILFDIDYYADSTGLADREMVLENFIRDSDGTGFPHPLYEKDYVWAKNPDLRSPQFDTCLLERVLIKAKSRDTDISHFFDSEFYRRNVGEFRGAGLVHYLTSGYKQGYDPHPLIDEHLYNERYQGGEPALPALVHFKLNEHKSDITLASRFPNRFYGERYSEAKAYSGSLLEHYLHHGRFEDRKISDPIWRDSFYGWSEVKAEIATLAALLDGAKPDVSVIVPVFNQFHFTLRCIWSLLNANDAATLQIIVVDDGSSDETHDFFSMIKGITYIRNPENLGFLRSCNNAVKSATAPYLFFLNNDTAVLPRAVDSLLETLRGVPNAGLAGSKLVYPDGTLQEAGGFIWRDGGGSNVGRNGDPFESGYNYLRDVDYVSGAAIMLAREVWDEVGGFDERYAPAYCEDSDLAMRLRTLGWRVLYQPASTVVHFEGVSSGTSLTSGIKSYQVVNFEKLSKKWAFALENHLPDQLVEPRTLPRPSRPRMLVIDQIVPKPDHDAGSVTALWYLRLLTDMGYDITFAPVNCYLDGKYGKVLQQLGVEVLHAPYVRDLNAYLEDHGAQFDVFLLYRFNGGGRYASMIKEHFPTATIIFNTVDLHYLRMERAAKQHGDKPEELVAAANAKKLELEVIEIADETILLSSAELDILRGECNSASLSVIPLVLESLPNVQPRGDRNGIAFVGGFQHRPNVDAVLYFVNKILPLLREKAPDLEVHIVGSQPPSEILSIEEPGVIVHGFVEDLDAFLDERIATIVPLKYGAGIKGKIASSMAAGVPVVSTTVGAEGMGLLHGRDLLVAESPDDFVDAVLAITGDDVLWNRISKNGKTFVETHFSPTITRDRLWRMLAKAGAVPFQGTCPITGRLEARRFLTDALDSLGAAENPVSSSERIAAKALMAMTAQPHLPLAKIPAKSLPDIAVIGPMPALKKAIAEVGALTEAASAKIGIVALDPAQAPNETLDNALSTLSACRRLILTLPSRGTLGAGVPEDHRTLRDTVRYLETAGWEVRIDRYPLKEAVVTRTILIEARTRKTP